MAYALDRAGLAFVPVVDAKSPTRVCDCSGPREARALARSAGRQNARSASCCLRCLTSWMWKSRGVELPRVLAAIEGHIKVPILIDAPALATEKIDIAEVKVTMPTKKRDVRDGAEQGARAPLSRSRTAGRRRQQAIWFWITTSRKATAEKEQQKAKAKDAAR